MTDSAPPVPPASGPLGTVATCWRYPVKSFQGLEVDQLTLDTGGFALDRTYGVVDETGHVLSAKRFSALLEASATDDVLTLPDGSTVAIDDPAVHDVLSSWLGRPVRLATPTSGEPVSYEMTFDPPNDGAELYEIPTPDGTFLDLFPVHLVTTATLSGAGAARPELDWDVRRFRPNLLLDVAGPAFVEGSWLGRHLRVGGAVLSIDSPTVRCAMPLRAQPGGIERQPELFRAMSELNTTHPNHLGAYCTVVQPGLVAVGDEVELQ